VRPRQIPPVRDDIEGNTGHDFVYGSQYLTFFLNPEQCQVNKSYYRNTLPQLDEHVNVTYQPSPCDALLLSHKWYGGALIVLGVLGLIGSFVGGVVLTKIFKPSVAWTIGLSGGSVILTFLTLVATLYYRY